MCKVNTKDVCVAINAVLTVLVWILLSFKDRAAYKL